MEKTKDLKKKSGITLVALVVTIIVLLILAGVSLSLVMGNDGILGKAEDAVDATLEASDKEAMDLADMAIKMDAYESNPSGKIDWSKYYTKENLEKYLNGKGTISNYTAENGTVKFEYTSNESNEKTKYEVNTKGELMVDIFANKITSANYGDTVKYTAPGLDGTGTITDWKIFYKEGKNVFLIASDFLPVSEIKDEVEVVKSGVYVAYWDAPTEKVVQPMNQLNLFKCSTEAINTTKGNTKFASRMLNTDNWNHMVNTKFATFAVGSPTIEMWIASWNQKYSSNKIYFDIIVAEEGSKTNAEGAQPGYTLSFDETMLNPYNTDKSDTMVKVANNDKLYFPHPVAGEETQVNGSFGYWLASPIAKYYGNTLSYVGNHGLVGNEGTSLASLSLRPVVCLKQDITVSTNANGEWELSE